MILHRRRLLKSALAAPAIIRPRSALAWGESLSALRINPVPFGAAAADVTAAGFTKLALYDDFTDTSGIDVNNTLKPGYRFYVTSPSSSCSPQAFAASNSILTFDNTITGVGGSIITQGYTATPPYTVGQSYGGGGYYEIRYAILAGAYSETFWMDDNAAAWIVRNGGSATYGEIDVAEFFRQADPTNAIEDTAAWQWEGTLVGLSTWPVLNMNSLHRFGMLWKTIAQGGGTGSLKFYRDGVNAAGSNITYSASDPLAILDNSAFALWLTNVRGKQLVDYIFCYQQP